MGAKAIEFLRDIQKTYDLSDERLLALLAEYIDKYTHLEHVCGWIENHLDEEKDSK